jgi:hypothetical protein
MERHVFPEIERAYPSGGDVAGIEFADFFGPDSAETRRLRVVAS